MSTKHLDNLKLPDTNASHFLELVVGSNLTADRTLTIYPGDASRSLYLTAIGCDVYNSGAQSCANATWVAMTADSEVFDTNSLHSTSVNTSRITIPTGFDGIWLISAYTAHAFNAAGGRGLAIKKNGTSFELTNHQPAIAATYGNAITTCGTLSLAAGDYVEALTWQLSGGNLNCTLTHFSAIFMGPLT